jgi:hypothetical protein
MGKNQTRPDDKVFEIVNNVLEHVFGAGTTLLIYSHLERRYSLKQSEISKHMNLLTRGLEDFFHDAAIPIEKKIMQELLSATSLESGICCQMMPQAYTVEDQIGIEAPHI